MRRLGPYALFLVALCMALVAGVPSVLETIYLLSGAGSDSFQDTGDGVRMSLAVSALMASLSGAGWFLFIARAEGKMEAYRAALDRVAEEFGKRAGINALGIGFSSPSYGVPLELRVDPRGHGMVVLTAECEPAVPIVLVREGTEIEDLEYADAGIGWTLYSQQPADAAGLFSELGARNLLDDLFSIEAVDDVTHDDRGLEIIAALVAPDELEALARHILDATVALVKANSAAPRGPRV